MYKDLLNYGSDIDSEWGINRYQEFEENDVSNHQRHLQNENDSPQNQFEQNYEDPELISTSIISNPHRCRQYKTNHPENQQVQIESSIIMNKSNTFNQQRSNITKNFPSQMGRLIINHLKQKKKNKKLNLKELKTMKDINKLINNDSIRNDVTQYFEGNQILFDVLSSSKLIDPSNVIEAFAPYHQAFKKKKQLTNQTW